MIKPFFEPLSPTDNSSFLVRKFEVAAFTFPYHFHPEFELALITKGEGKRYVGNHMEYYKEGDFILLGANLPHCWKTDPVVKENNGSSIVIQFTGDFLGHELFEKKELLGIKELLLKSKRGISYNEAEVKKVREKMISISEEKVEFKRLILLLDILHDLAACKKYVLLDTESYISLQPTSEMQRINSIFGYIIDNFKFNVSLVDAAKLANMSKNAFCKYFKKITRKTFIEVVIDYRLNYANQQLIHTSKTVTDICFESGFNDVAHFSRMFKKKMKLSPLQYRNSFMKNIEE
jgi:AraC-like DNA-binding protein